ncbi:MAG: N-acetylglucosamine kinase, partial [Devosia sp.]|nr:N-acetylglucosamine kinase [Devosia sp.]
MSRPIHLGIDVGGTASRWVACADSGEIVARGKAGGATGHVFNPAEHERLRLALTALAQDLAAAGCTPCSVTAGITGYGTAVAQQTTALVSTVLNAGRDSIVLLDDMALAYMAVFAPGEGHLVSAGTGSIGLHIDRHNAHIRVGGRGILIDDAGSGSWIALRALDRIYRGLDQSGSFDASPALARHLFAAIGGQDWSSVRQFVYGGDRGMIGSLAVAVAQAADEGDQVAQAILREAAGELARLAQALIARAGVRPVGFIGRVLDLHPIVR